MKLKLRLAFLLLFLLGASSAFAELKTIGEGATMQADTSAFPPEMKKKYDLFKVKCVKCHGNDRNLLSLKDGVTPSGSVFDKEAIQAYGAKMLRKPDSGMTKQEVITAIEVMNYMLDLASK